MYLISLCGCPYKLLKSKKKAIDELKDSGESGQVEKIVFGKDFQDNKIVFDWDPDE